MYFISKLIVMHLDLGEIKSILNHSDLSLACYHHNLIDGNRMRMREMGMGR